MNLMEFLQGVSEERKLQIMRDYATLRKNGAIGDCELRRTVQEYMKILGDGSVTSMWLELIAKEVAYEFAMEHMRIIEGEYDD